VTGRRSLRGLASALTLAWLVALGAACSLPADNEPRAIPEENLPEGLQVEVTTTAPAPGDETRLVYFVEEPEGESARLIAVERSVSPDAGWRDVLEIVLAGPEGEENRTNIPPDVELLGAELDEETGTLTIDLSEEMRDRAGAQLDLAFGQIVLTVTEFDEVDQVRFRIEGEDTPVGVAEGESKPVVTRADYEPYDPGVSDP
jgi:spore germination protein GerM